MKLVKSLLLSSAAGISAVAGAQAADLPFRKAAPVEYVRVCDFAGAGYFYIPGSDTCLKIGGYAQGNFAYVSPERVYFDALNGAGVGVAATLGLPGGQIVNPVNRNQTGFLGEGRIELDARTQTAYGTVRALVRMDGDVGAGYYSQNPQGSSINNPNGTATGSNAVAITKVFIQFAGFTAGRVQSFYDFYADNYGQEGVANSDQSNIAFAYTATFGGGFSATIAAEDGANRRGGIKNSVDRTTFVGAGGYDGATTVAYGGEEIPDIIGVVRYDQAWGAAQLSGAYHQVRAFVQGLNGIAQDTIDLTDDGFAVQAGVQIKLPMLAAGDDLWLEGGYQNGAYQYQNSTGSPNNGYQGVVAGGLFYKGYDAIALRNGAGGYSLQLSDGFHVDGAFRHFFTPTFSDTVYGSYEENDYGGARNTDWTLGGQGHVSSYRILNQFTWTPVNNLLVQVDAGYFHVDQNLAHEPGAAPSLLPAGVKTSSDGFEGRLRVERDF